MLQSLLQPRVSHSPNMIGALPAVTVRHERRRNEKRRASQRGTSPSPPPSPQNGRRARPLPDYYVFGKVSALHAVVGCLLLGGVVLVVGLVQLSPGAEAAQHRYLFLGAGTALLSLGLALIGFRCYCIHCHHKASHGVKENGVENHDPVSKTQQPSKNGVSSVDSAVEAKHQGPESDSLIKAAPGISPKETSDT